MHKLKLLFLGNHPSFQTSQMLFDIGFDFMYINMFTNPDLLHFYVLCNMLSMILPVRECVDPSDDRSAWNSLYVWLLPRFYQ